MKHHQNKGLLWIFIYIFQEKLENFYLFRKKPDKNRKV